MRYSFGFVIRSFRHKGLRELFETGQSGKVRPDLRERALRRLDVLHRAATLRDLDIPGLGFHALNGMPRRFSVRVNGPWRITFEWAEGNALRVDLEQYH